MVNGSQWKNRRTMAISNQILESGQRVRLDRDVECYSRIRGHAFDDGPQAMFGARQQQSVVRQRPERFGPVDAKTCVCVSNEQQTFHQQGAGRNRTSKLRVVEYRYIDFTSLQPIEQITGERADKSQFDPRLCLAERIDQGHGHYFRNRRRHANHDAATDRCEPPRVFRRPFRLSHAAMACSACMAW